MPTLPATTAGLSFGKVYAAYTNVPVNTAGNATTSPPYTGSQNIKLSATLGVGFGSKVAGAQISFASTFGGQTTPFPYP